MVANKDIDRIEKVNKKKKIYINFHIAGDTKTMFLEIKKHYNLLYNMEVFRVMVKKIHDNIFKKSK